MKIAVIGAGAWGTALSLLAHGQGHSVILWARREQEARQIASTRISSYLKDHPLPPKIKVTADLGDAVAAAEVVILAVPSHGMREIATHLRPVIHSRPLLGVAKGLEGTTFQRMSEVIADVLGANEYAALSGPSFAQDVAQGKPTAVVVASKRIHWAQEIQRNLSGPTFRLYTTDDVAGVELGGAMKNVMAIAAGVSDGLGLGESTRAALITRGLAEMVRLGEKLGGQRETFFGLSGLGDLVLTCGGQQSRNHQVGERLAHGEVLEKIVASMNGVAEGVRNARSFLHVASRHKIDAPIIRSTYGILYEDVPPLQAVEELMSRELKKE
jgi:glycerol-3-phosphate dehydrogenase (NAD(P)+)